jgi:NAD(P)H-dependent flavin oxidoreductase YrpB (nitropropane dioxygenase family)
VIRTELCDLVGIRHPIVQAGMGPYSTNRLAVAAANAGALGIVSTSGLVLGSVYPRLRELVAEGEQGTTYEVLKKVLSRAVEATSRSKGVIGINCLVSAELVPAVGEILQAAIDVGKEHGNGGGRLGVVITSAGDPMPWAEMLKPSGLTWFHVVPSVRHALRAERAGVDAVIASGHEGGYHVAWEPVHTMVLLPAVVRAVKVPVIGAGGFCDGATLAAALALGAVGVQMGTRFLATTESDFVEVWKNQVLRSGERDTLVARGLVGPARYLRNEASRNLAHITVSRTPGLFLGQPDEMAGIDPDVLRAETEGLEATFAGDDARALVTGGEVAGRIGDIRPVGDLIEEIVREAEQVILGLQQRVVET